MTTAHRAPDGAQACTHQRVADDLEMIAHAAVQLGARLRRLSTALLDSDARPRRLDAAACLAIAQDALDLADLTGSSPEVALAESLHRVLADRSRLDPEPQALSEIACARAGFGRERLAG